MTALKKLLGPLVLVLCIPASCYGQSMMLYKDNQSSFSIIIKANPTDMEKSAASELQYHLKKTS